MKQDIYWKDTEEYQRSFQEMSQLRRKRKQRQLRWMLAAVILVLVCAWMVVSAISRGQQLDQQERQILEKLTWEVPLSFDYKTDIFHGQGVKYGMIMTTEEKKDSLNAFLPPSTLYGVDTLSGEEILPAAFTEITAYPDEAYFIASCETEGETREQYYSWDGVPLLSEPAVWVYAFQGDYGVVNRSGDLWSIIDRRGQELYSAECKDLYCVDETRGIFAKGYLDGYKTKEKFMTSYSGPTLYGLIDASGAEILPQTHGRISNVGEGMLLVEEQTGLAYYYLNEKLERISEKTYVRAGDFSEGLAAVKETEESDVFSFIDHSGTVLFTAVCNEPESFQNGRVVLAHGTDLFCIDGQGNTLLADCGKQRSISIGKWGTLSQTQQFREGLLAYLNNDGKYGYMDQSGAMVIEPIFDWAEDFENGMAEVTLAGKTGLLKNPLK